MLQTQVCDLSGIWTPIVSETFAVNSSVSNDTFWLTDTAGLHWHFTFSCFKLYHTFFLGQTDLLKAFKLWSQKTLLLGKHIPNAFNTRTSVA
jgi:hypothetical protein